MIQRKAEKFLSNWLGRKPRKPLVLRGARQVGKSTLVRQFARSKGLILNEVNLERHLMLDELFKTTDIENIIHQRQSTLAVRFDLNPPSLQEVSCLTTTANGSAKVKFPLLSLPLYAVDELARVISQSITP